VCGLGRRVLEVTRGPGRRVVGRRVVGMHAGHAWMRDAQPRSDDQRGCAGLFMGVDARGRALGVLRSQPHVERFVGGSGVLSVDLEGTVDESMAVRWGEDTRRTAEQPLRLRTVGTSRHVTSSQAKPSQVKSSRVKSREQPLRLRTVATSRQVKSSQVKSREQPLRLRTVATSRQVKSSRVKSMEQPLCLRPVATSRQVESSRVKSREQPLRLRGEAWRVRERERVTVRVGEGGCSFAACRFVSRVPLTTRHGEIYGRARPRLRARVRERARDRACHPPS
jgi:hypothetical protein